jgi:hypothetical protein
MIVESTTLDEGMRACMWSRQCVVTPHRGTSPDACTAPTHKDGRKPPQTAAESARAREAMRCKEGGRGREVEFFTDLTTPRWTVGCGSAMIDICFRGCYLRGETGVQSVRAARVCRGKTSLSLNSVYRHTFTQSVGVGVCGFVGGSNPKAIKARQCGSHSTGGGGECSGGV